MCLNRAWKIVFQINIYTYLYIYIYRERERERVFKIIAVMTVILMTVN